jgi:two-component system NtrC family response regulator
MAQVLIIDDDPLIGDLLSMVFKRMDHETTVALTLEAGLQQVYAGCMDVVFLDVNLPDGNGLGLLPEISRAPCRPEVIIMTGAGDPEGAELAIKSGAWDYLEKGQASTQVMMLALTRALQYRHDKKGAAPPVLLKRAGIVGESRPIMDCLELVSQAAGGDSNVLLTGETGTGKELLARAIHENSDRADGNLVVVDCTALPENLVESLLFGHEKGAFTGADRTKTGLVPQADHGTLFLDEVGELPLNLQKSFLRVLQERRFRAVGSQVEKDVDFRLVAATNRNLEEMARQNLFRHDLLFRLRAFVIELPPLRDRLIDLQDLVMYHSTQLCRRYGLATKGYSPEFLETLKAHDWPGNVRELVNVLERALTKAWNEPTLFPKHIPEEIRIKSVHQVLGREPVELARQEVSSAPAGLPTWKEARAEVLAEAERDYLQKLMDQTGYDLDQAIGVSGLKRSRLYQLLKKHGLGGRL